MNKTAFGDGADGVFFTGKPKVDNALGYAFLFRNYRPDHGKWLTADPMGYPDGWNNLAYCKNEILQHFDYLGTFDYTAEQLWAMCYVVAQAGRLREANDPYAYNFTGFYQWLTGNGDPQYLDWQMFDKNFVNANWLLSDTYAKNKIQKNSFLATLP